MNKLIGRRVKLVMASADLTDYASALLSDRHYVGDVLTIMDISSYSVSKWPVQCVDDGYGRDVYKPEQLRYLNNKPVKV